MYFAACLLSMMAFSVPFAILLHDKIPKCPPDTFCFLLFCYTVSYQSSSSFFSKRILPDGSSNHEKSSYLVSAHLAGSSAKSENLRVQVSNNCQSWYDATSLLISYRIAELTLHNKLLDYLVLSKSIVVRLQRTTIIFPFHYFL